MKQIFVNKSSSFVAATTTYLAPMAGLEWSATLIEDRVSQEGEFGFLRIAQVSAAHGGNWTMGAGSTMTYVLAVNDVVTDVSVTLIEGEAQGAYLDWGAPVFVGDKITLKRVYTGSDLAGHTTGGTLSVSMAFKTDTPRTSLYGGAGLVLPTSGSRFVSPFNARTTAATAATENGSGIVALAGTITYHTVNLASATGDATGWTFYLVKNGTRQDGTGGTADTAIALSTSTSEGAASFSLAVVAGDVLSVEAVVTGSPLAQTFDYGVRFVASSGTYGDSDYVFQISGSHGSLDTSNTAQYHVPNLNAGTDINETRAAVYVTGRALNVTEDDEGSAFWLNTGEMYVQLAAAPGSGNSRIWTERVNLTDGASGPITLEDAETTGNSGGTAGLTLVDTNRFSVKRVGDSFPDATDYVWWSMLASVGQNFYTAVAGDGGTITGISPDNGPIAGGTAFTITGTDFPTDADNVRVLLRGIEATSVVVNSATEVVGVSGASLTAGLGSVQIIFEYDADDDATATLADEWTYTTSSQWYSIDPDGIDLEAAGLDPNTPASSGTIFFFGSAPPGAGWSVGTEPSFNGWWWSAEGMAGVPFIVDDSDNPEPPRSWDKITDFATGAADHLGGGGVAVAFRNKMVYAAHAYTGGTTNPPIRVFDGQSDRFLTAIPPDSGSAVALAVMTMIVANGTIYVASLDTGGNGGRVFELDLASASLTPLGAAFSGGEVPYALAYGMGRLWVGTNNGDGTPGRVLYIRPDIDTAFTEDEDFASTLGGVCALAFYNGLLYAGLDNESGAAGEVRVRAMSGTWSQSVAGSGTAAMNGYTALHVFENKLYGLYYDSAGPTLLIRRYDGSSWGTVYTAGDAATRKTGVALFTHRQHIYALLGVAGEAAQLLRSDTGDSSDWTDLAAFLTEAGTVEATPAFASVRF